MIKQNCKPDYLKMTEAELKDLLSKQKRLLTKSSMINSLPDKGERIRKSIAEIESYLKQPTSPMDCETIMNRFHLMKMSSEDGEESRPIQTTNVFFGASHRNVIEKKVDNDFSETRLRQVKQRLQAKQEQRKKETTIHSIKLIDLGEAMRLQEEQKKRDEEYLIQQTTARLLGGMSIGKNTFGLPTGTTATNSLYRRTATEKNNDSDDEFDELGRNRAEISSDHDSDEIDYPDERQSDDDDDENNNGKFEKNEQKTDSTTTDG